MPHLTVALNGFEIGTLTTNRSGGMSFSYAEQWLKQPGARALSLSLPLTNQRYEGAQVYNFFDNLLPDSENIRARMQARFKIKTGHYQPYTEATDRFSGATQY